MTFCPLPVLFSWPFACTCTVTAIVSTLTDRLIDGARENSTWPGRQGELTQPNSSLLDTLAVLIMAKTHYIQRQFFLGGRWSTSLTDPSKQLNIRFALYSFLCSSTESENLSRHRFWPSSHIQIGKLEERSIPLMIAWETQTSEHE